jgi:hypothetical protein
VVGIQEWVTYIYSSEDEDIVGIAITNHEIPLPPPPMCLMAKGNSKVNYKAGGKPAVNIGFLIVVALSI